MMLPTPMPISILSLLLVGTLGIVGFISLAGVIALPFLLIFDLFKLFNKNRIILIEKIGSDKTLIYHFCVVAIWIVSMLIISYQPSNNRLINNLVNFGNKTTYGDKKLLAVDISRQEATLKQMITDMMSARNRYPFMEDDNSIEQAYRDVFYFTSASQIPEYIQKSFLSLAAPFVYRGEKSLAYDAQRAYESFFGHTIYKETYKPVENKDVVVVARTINATSSKDGLLATISIEEEFASNTSQQEEVIYEFALPNEAVVTDLKLGPNLEFDGIVAPRGAAQRTYEQQLVQRRDPALMEQTGPRQYRLRIFPIPGKNDRVTLNGRNQRVKYSYVVALSEKGFALPEFSKKLNIDDNLQTRNQVSLDGKTIILRKDEQFINSSGSGIDLCHERFTNSIMTKVGNASLRLVPYASISQIKSDLPCSLATGTGLVSTIGSNIAILYDVSYQNKNDVTINDIKNILRDNKSFFSDNQVDWYEFNSQLSEAIRLTSDTQDKTFDVPYFGLSKPLEALKSLSKNYDLVILVTADTASFSQNTTDYQKLPTAVAIVHTKEKPAYRNEFTNSLLQQGGGVYDSLRTALISFALEKRLKPGSSERYVAFNSYWALALVEPVTPQINIKSAPGIALDVFEPPQSPIFPMPTPEPTNQALWEKPTYESNNPLLSYGNMQYLRYKLTQYQGQLSNNTIFLDAANNFASLAHIVSPYSSMIALVNAQQMEDLRRNLQDSSRYTEGVTPQITNNIDRRSFMSNESAFGVTEFGGGILNPIRSNAPSLKIAQLAPEGDISTIGITGYGQRSSNVGSFLGGSSFLTLFIIINVLLVGGAVVIMGLKKVLKRRK